MKLVSLTLWKFHQLVMTAKKNFMGTDTHHIILSQQSFHPMDNLTGLNFITFFQRDILRLKPHAFFPFFKLWFLYCATAFNTWNNKVLGLIVNKPYLTVCTVQLRSVLFLCQLPHKKGYLYFNTLITFMEQLFT